MTSSPRNVPNISGKKFSREVKSVFVMHDGNLAKAERPTAGICLSILLIRAYTCNWVYRKNAPIAQYSAGKYKNVFR